jgi:glutamine amidotransferase
MARLLGFIGNRPDLGSRALALESASLEVRRSERVAHEGGLSWGVGFYQGGELLLKRRPIDDRARINFADLTREIRADVLVGHIRTATVGALKTENTHPFRYRQWLFAETGTVPKFEVLGSRLRDSLPQFLARDVRGDTDAELVFYLFLSFLHDAGSLNREIAPADARSALRSTVALVDRLCAEEGEGPAALNMVLASGDYVIALRRSGAMAYSVMQGKQALERLYGNEELSKLKIPHLASCRLSVVASDFEDDRPPSGWTPLPERTTLTLTRTDAPLIEPL